MLTIESVIAHLEKNYYMVRKPVEDKAAIQRIIEVVCGAFCVDVFTVLSSKTRKHEIVNARQIIAYIAMEKFFISDTELSTVIARNRTTINQSCSKVKLLMSYDKKYKNKIDQLCATLLPISK